MARDGVRQELDLDDIQGLLAGGYGSLTYATFLLLGIDDATSARPVLSRWAGRVTPASDRPRDEAVNVALTSAGVEALSSGRPFADGFSEQFVSGMATTYRSRLLGDVGDESPSSWAWGGPASDPVHVLVLTYARTDGLLERLCRELLDEAEGNGLRLVQQLETSPLEPTEPFGFHDGISQPLVEGLGRGTDRLAGEVRAGEFVLGYTNEHGQVSQRPLLPGVADARSLLPRDESGRADLGRNGSYLVMRQLRQDVDAFWTFADEASRGEDGVPDGEARELLAAKMVGRWPSGAPLTLAAKHDDPALADENSFGYHETDPRGLACPIGSHVRRVNPRDSLEPDPGSDESLAINRRHRLLRRGRSYGPATGGGERGLFFVCLNANLARQYEFVQHTWVNNPSFNGLYDEPDPLIGPRGEKGTYFTLPGKPVRRRYADLPHFVSVRGGAYFFLPGIRALRYLAADPPTRGRA